VLSSTPTTDTACSTETLVTTCRTTCNTAQMASVVKYASTQKDGRIDTVILTGVPQDFICCCKSLLLPGIQPRSYSTQPSHFIATLAYFMFFSRETAGVREYSSYLFPVIGTVVYRTVTKHLYTYVRLLFTYPLAERTTTHSYAF
jgi:hypothetical protein